MNITIVVITKTIIVIITIEITIVKISNAFKTIVLHQTNQ